MTPLVSGPDISSRTLFDRILADGFASATLTDSDAELLAELHRHAMAFFAQDARTRLRHSIPNRTTGYREFSYAHSGSPDARDLNDSFLYWGEGNKPVPNGAEISPFLHAFEAYRQVVAGITADVIAGMSTHYDYPHKLGFEDASVLQINSFDTPVDRELLQTPHEDAVFLTVIWCSAPGLEAVDGDAVRPIAFPHNEVLVMPGSVMTDMTGGEVPPFFHQARNHRELGRKSVMYFVSPNVDGPVEPFVVTDHNRGMDIRQRIIDNPQTFGLAEDFVPL